MKQEESDEANTNYDFQASVKHLLEGAERLLARGTLFKEGISELSDILREVIGMMALESNDSLSSSPDNEIYNSSRHFEVISSQDYSYAPPNYFDAPFHEFSREESTYDSLMRQYIDALPLFSPSENIEHSIDIPEDENYIIAPVVESLTLEAMLGFVMTNEPLGLVLWVAGTK